MSFIIYYLKKAFSWIPLGKTIPIPGKDSEGAQRWYGGNQPSPYQNGTQNIIKPEVTLEDGKKILRAELTRRVEKGWSIEIENESDAVLSKKSSIAWPLHIFMIIFFLVVFPVMSFIWLIVMIILAITKKPQRMRIWVEKDGSLYFR